MAVLPRVHLEWSEHTSIALEDFLRYQVYRRKQSESVWNKLVRINARGSTAYDDFTGVSGVVYEYVITAVKDVAGEEVEGVFGTPATAMHAFTGTWLHDFTLPSKSTELMTSGRVRSRVNHDVSFTEVWSKAAPIAHIGKRFNKSISIPVEWVQGEQKWEEIEALIQSQIDTAASMVLRDRYGEKLFCVIASISHGVGRSTLMSISLSVQEIDFNEYVV